MGEAIHENALYPGDEGISAALEQDEKLIEITCIHTAPTCSAHITGPTPRQIRVPKSGP